MLSVTENLRIEIFKGQIKTIVLGKCKFENRKQSMVMELSGSFEQSGFQTKESTI